MLIISLLDGHSEMAPPDPIPNSAVKRLSANGSAVRPCESRSPSSFFFGFELYFYRITDRFCIQVDALCLNFVAFKLSIYKRKISSLGPCKLRIR